MTSRRFANVDALRGLAAVLVIWLHASEVFVQLPAVAARGTAWFDAADLLGIGRTGVVAFFAISGYVIVPTLRGGRVDGTVDFLIKRGLRLFPPFWLAIALSAGSVWWLFGRDLDVFTVVANATMVPLEFGAPQMMGHFWTLEVELIFYALVLVFFWSGTLHRHAVVAGWMLGLTVAWAVLFRSHFGRAIVDHNLVWSYLAYFLAIMFWGAMVRDRQAGVAGASAASGRPSWPFHLMTAIVFGRPLIALVFGSTTVHREDWRGTLLGLILFLVAIRVPDRFARPFVWLGTISYSLYLLHPAVFYPLYYAVAHDPRWSGAPLFVYIALSVIGSVACAALAYRVVERPANALARRWVDRRRARRLRADGSATIA